MPFRETLLNLAITAVLVLIITLVAILLRESRPVPIAIAVGKAKPASQAVPPGAELTVPEFKAFPKARLIESRANEADTLRIKLDDTHEETIFSLYFVDAPDTTLTHPQRVQEQERWFGTTQNGILKAGAEATAYVTGLLKDRTFTVLTRWEPVPDRSRYYALIRIKTEKGEVYLADLLMQQGHARVAGITCELPGGVQGIDDYGHHLLELGKKARVAKLGIWRR